MGRTPFRVEAVLPENAKTYFLERDSAAFRALLSKVLKLGTMEMTETWKDGESTYVRIVTRPDFGNWVPKGVQGQASDRAIEFHDVIEYNPALIQRPPFQINVKTESPFLGEKLDVRLALIIEEIDENTCRQVLTGHIKVSMFGVGGIVEGIVKDSLRNTYKKLPEIVRRWQMFRAEALQNGNAKELLCGRPPVGCSISWIRAEVLTLMQSPIEAEAVLPPASPTGVVCPDDLSQFSTDEAAAAGAAPAAAGAIAPGPPAGAMAPGPPAGAIAPGPPAGATAAAAAVAAQEEPPELPSVGRSTLRSSYTEYYDAAEVLEEGDTATSPPPLLPRRRRELLVLEVPEEEEPPLAARHRRNVSTESADSSALEGAGASFGGTGPPSPWQKRPSSQRSWRHFNNAYEEWTAYWDIMGVKHMAPPAPPSGPLAFLYRAQETVRESASTVMFSMYLYALRKGLVTAEPDEAGRYAGKAPRLDLDPQRAQQRSSEGLHRNLSLPSSPGGRSQGGETDKAGLLGSKRDPSDKCEYGNTDQAAALVARTTERRISAQGHHRRAVSVDTGTAAAAREPSGLRIGGSRSGGALGGGGRPPAPGQQGPPSRKHNGSSNGGLMRARDDSDLVSPPARFSCLPVCWHRRRPLPAPSHDNTRR